MKVEVNIPVTVEVTQEMIDATVKAFIEKGDYVEVVRCKDCRYKPEGEDGQGFGLRFPEEGKCPCENTDDGWYSYMPDDDWYCPNGARKEADDGEG